MRHDTYTGNVICSSSHGEIIRVLRPPPAILVEDSDSFDTRLGETRVLYEVFLEFALMGSSSHAPCAPTCSGAILGASA